MTGFSRKRSLLIVAGAPVAALYDRFCYIEVEQKLKGFTLPQGRVVQLQLDAGSLAAGRFQVINLPVAGHDGTVWTEYQTNFFQIAGLEVSIYEQC